MIDQANSDDTASVKNRFLTKSIAEAGTRMGLDVRLEYPIAGGRIDVMWIWNPPSPIPGLATSVPLVGFEIESSWRTRKHVKGDMVNLQDAGVALGVIVLSGADKRDDALRRFASALVKRPGTKILIWTEDEVHALANSEEVITSFEAADIEQAMKDGGEHTYEVQISDDFTGKYRPLWQWLRAHARQPLRISFKELEQKAGISLPPSSRKRMPHWYGYEGSAVARAIRDAGWKASEVDLNAEMVTLSPR